MEADGSFFLKNLGKSPVSVNGMTIETGEFLSLGSSCLIEVLFLHTRDCINCFFVLNLRFYHEINFFTPPITYFTSI